jgi:hypothetical protein
MVVSDQIDLFRKARLALLSTQMRQASLERPDDLEGWYISRMLREATTSAEADEAERRLQSHLQQNA